MSYLVLLLVASTSCKSDKVERVFHSQNVIVIVVDGPRMSETWDEPNRPNIPFQAGLLQEGVLLQNFRNDGLTWTMNGHCAITTGNYVDIVNSGAELPHVPSIFQLYRKQYNLDSTDVWLVASKGKIEALANCDDSLWFNKFLPATNCGINAGGVASGYRDDSTTFEVVMDVLETHHPKLMLVNFKEPDVSGHLQDSTGYIQGIRDTDAYIQHIWQFIQSDPKYKGKTTLIVTNDHGRHLNGVSGGYGGHGDGCEGCRHISMLGLGPDFKQNAVINDAYNQTDLTATIAEILGIEMPQGQGKPIKRIYR
ncbi:MAG: alkaline phosphatase family protein [bacterium]|nr:alkaline phosphatase family protein [bacterium]